jgi:hypothetical protein
MMMLGFGFLLQRLASEEVLFLLLLTEIFGAFGVVTLHFEALFRGEGWEVADKKDQLPTIFRWAMPTEGGHTGEANAIFNDPEDFTVGKILSFGFSEIGRLRIKATSHHGVTTSVVTVTNGAMVGEMQPGLAKNFGRRGNGTFG